MTAPALNPPKRILMGPGPSDIHPRVLEAIGKDTVGHLDPFYLETMNEMQNMLRALMKTENPLTFAVSATGSAGMETAIVNSVEPGDNMLVCINGVFGNRMTDVAERAGANVSNIEKPWGEVFSVDDIVQGIEQSNPAVVGIVMAETSTGAFQPIKEIAQAVRDAGALLLVDAVTSLGGMNVEVDNWGIDILYSGSQKCLSCPPGLAPVSFGPRAVEKLNNRKEKVRSWYLDATMLASYWGEERVYHHTAPINMTYALYEALRVIHEEGLENCFKRHLDTHRALKAGLETLRIEYNADPNHQLPMLNAVKIPDGIDDGAVRSSLLNEFGIEIGGGLGAFKGKVWRIGLMGYAAREKNVVLFLSALEELLKRQGYQLEPGAAVAAANSIFQS
ncbi:MAG TPA: alanine--glyoxylate aminotransferase [Planctomycetaceae bacterium]|jgi:alanine-glyoxylate transaminase/serine-glyoxylate transaminase/serine-pyruvate transaminase|nr:alanine--glyoxylate aminotransferase [Rhodopirellula sp.]MCH2362198.1 alanine--glyoxylate aminotransferase family protein [Pirellulales bacterium]HAL15082.1 alanine--glyoxylate aminotransferase [Planctomycetaceae bacterium]HCP85505.1 alanine--glyoxylate aminotransferase [Planctomycetaceae bacterium]|tara:strand:+ start:2291 stop:3463 length:1173 start_codon:yes stop_codon:yes gene_type:complete